MSTLTKTRTYLVKSVSGIYFSKRVKLFAEGGGAAPYYYPGLLGHGGDSLPSSQYLLSLGGMDILFPLYS